MKRKVNQYRRTSPFHRRFGLIAVSVLVLLSACAVPPPPIPEDPWRDLGAEALLYVKADFPGAKPLVQGMLAQATLVDNGMVKLGNAQQLEENLDRCDRVHGAFWSEGAAQRWRMKAVGRFPAFWGELSLAFNSNWKKETTASRYFWRSNDGPGLVFLTESVVLASDAVPFAADDGPKMPDRYQAEYEKATVWVWLTEAEMFVARLLGPKLSSIRIPVKEIRIVIIAGTSDWQSTVIIRFAAERDVIAFSALARIAKNLLRSVPNEEVADDNSPALARLILASDMVANGEELTFHLEPLTTEALLTVLDGFQTGAD